MIIICNFNTKADANISFFVVHLHHKSKINLLKAFITLLYAPACVFFVCIIMLYFYLVQMKMKITWLMWKAKNVSLSQSLLLPIAFFLPGHIYQKIQSFIQRT